MTERVDCVVIGAGVVGLACAKWLAEAGREGIVLEASDMIGSETSSRNSEVVHAGIYYPTGSFKAKACVEGKHFLYDYCAERGIPHKRLGKLIVASAESELPRLDALKAQADANGVPDLEYLSPESVRQLEPEVFCVGALLSPSTGIIDSHSLMLAYQGDAEETVPKDYLAKGNYYSLLGKQPFRHLVYPMPVPGGLGVHVTLDMGGQCKFGPDVEWIERIDYDVDPRRADSFYDAVRTYYPGLVDGALVPSYSGIRPKIHGPGEPQPDFLVQGPAAHSVPGLVNLYGIESPGLTASPAIAREVLRQLGMES